MSTPQAGVWTATPWETAIPGQHSGSINAARTPAADGRRPRFAEHAAATERTNQGTGLSSTPLTHHGKSVADRASGLGVFIVVLAAVTAYRIAALIALDLDPYVDEAYYWGWAQSLDWGYYSKPPLLPGLIALSQRAFGDSLLTLKLPSLLLYPATALVVRELGRSLFDERVGQCCGLVFLTLPLVSVLGLFASTDAPLLFFWALGMWMLWRVLETDELPYWLGIGVVAGLGLLSKYTMAAFAVSALMFMASDAEGRRLFARRGPWLGALVAVGILMPNLWWNAEHGFPTVQHTAEITRIGAWDWNPDEFFEFLGAQAIALGIVPTFVLVWCLVRPAGMIEARRRRFLLAFTLPLLAIASLQALVGRANGNWAAPALIGACVLVVAFLVRSRRLRLLAFALVINATMGVAVYQWPDILRLTGIELHAGTDPFKRARGWRELADRLRPVLAAHPDAVLVSDDRELLAQLVYALHPARHARWQPTTHVADHYGLVAPYGRERGTPVLFVSARRDLGDVLARFGSADQLADLEAEVHHNFRRRASVWLLHDFRGY